MAHLRPPLPVSCPRACGRHHHDGLAAPGDSGGAASLLVGGASEAWLLGAVTLPPAGFEDVRVARRRFLDVRRSDGGQLTPRPIPGRNLGGLLAARSAAGGGGGGGGGGEVGGG